MKTKEYNIKMGKAIFCGLILAICFCDQVISQNKNLYLLFDESSPDIIKERIPVSTETAYYYKFKILEKNRSYNKAVLHYTGEKLPAGKDITASSDDFVRFTSWGIDSVMTDTTSFQSTVTKNLKDINWLRQYYFDFYYNLKREQGFFFFSLKLNDDFKDIFIVQLDSAQSKTYLEKVNYGPPPSY